MNTARPRDGRPPRAASPAGRETLSAEWALWGKDAADSEYRMLRCSSGLYTSRDLTCVLDRYSPGTLGRRELPQAAVSWLPDPDAGGPSHIGLAMYETADAAPPGERPRSQLDRAGRPITYVRFFCVPYASLARHAIGYQQLHDTFGRQPVPRNGHGPVTAVLAAPRMQPPAESEDRFARCVAAQLLASRPVCVLGGGALTAEDRLRFTDLVMSWLPYGARAEMSAATWVDSSYTGHRHRLFFTSAPRDDPRAPSQAPPRPGRRQPDITLRWGVPAYPAETGPVTTAYLRWHDLHGPAARDLVARDTAPASLKNATTVTAMLRRFVPGGEQARRPPRAAGPVRRAGSPPPARRR